MLEFNEKRILLVDDNASIHEDFRKILNQEQDSSILASYKEKLFGNANPLTTDRKTTSIILDSAYQGAEAVELVKKSLSEKRPYCLAFVDIRMPPGWDGIVTIQKLWEIDPNIQMVICSAHSDYSWEEMHRQLQDTDNLLILKKPFDLIEIRQITSALTIKWELARQVEFQIQNLEDMIAQRTLELRKANQNLDESLSLTTATLESTQEGILALDENENILVSNQKLLNVWNIDPRLIDNGSSMSILKHMAEQVDDPSAFLTMISNQCKEPKKEMIKELKLNNGQILELYIHPRYLHEESRGVVLSFREITERKFLEEQLLHQATHDALTGLPNRILLNDRLQQAIAYAKRNNLFVGVFMLDLDNFKFINDSLGHNAGDILLTLVAQKLLTNFRESDTVTRFGGDEFVITVASQARIEDLMFKADKLLELFNQPFVINDRAVNVTPSLGISIYPQDGVTPDELIKTADSALYHAKDMGRNNYKFYVAEYNDNILKRLELKTALQQALDKNQFSLDYQPLLKLDSKQIIGVEALLRWNHPTLGVIMPNHFIPIAEESGLIINIGNWVLKTACAQNKLWQQTIHPELTIAVNISGRQIMQANFIDIVKQVLNETQLGPQYLELEITENLILENSSTVSNAMNELKDMGVKLSMDDFGIGYSSLNYVKYFPFDKIKIDKSFIDGINLNLDDKNIVEAIINMTKSMGLEVLAEGVETKEQIDFLYSRHSNQIQGFYVSPPLDVKGCSEFLTRHLHQTEHHTDPSQGDSANSTDKPI